jgi:hypothetical protein
MNTFVYDYSVRSDGNALIMWYALADDAKHLWQFIQSFSYSLPSNSTQHSIRNLVLKGPFIPRIFEYPNNALQRSDGCQRAAGPTASFVK